MPKFIEIYQYSYEAEYICMDHIERIRYEDRSKTMGDVSDYPHEIILYMNNDKHSHHSMTYRTLKEAEEKLNELIGSDVNNTQTKDKQEQSYYKGKVTTSEMLETIQEYYADDPLSHVSMLEDVIKNELTLEEAYKRVKTELLKQQAQFA